eukprot:SAG31_NODE_25137_length_467_cov_0.883152_2_plen_99_part_01
MKKLKVLVDETLPLSLPSTVTREICGLGVWSVGTLIMMIGLLVTTMPLLIFDQIDTLSQARDALCAGKLDFVYTLSGTGAPMWAETSECDPMASKSIVR